MYYENGFQMCDCGAPVWKEGFCKACYSPDASEAVEMLEGVSINQTAGTSAIDGGEE